MTAPTQASAGERESAGRIPQLDGIRGLAIALILVWHYVAAQLRATPGSLSAYAIKCLYLTWAGVDVFFVLSGFLIGGILLDRRESPHYFRTFYIRRFCRIFPLYYLMFGLFALAVGLRLARQGGGFGWLFGGALPLWTYGTFLQNFAMTLTGSMNAHWIAMSWSLAVEEQFYLVLPLLLRLVPGAWLPACLGVMIVSATLIRAWLFWTFRSPYGGMAGYVLLPARWDALLLGVLGAWLLRDARWRDELARRQPWIRVVLAATASLALVLLLAQQGIGSLGMTLGGYTILASSSLSVILLVLLDRRSALGRFFTLRPLVWLGTVSYGVYMFHQPVSGLLHHLLRHQSPRLVDLKDASITGLALVTTLAVAGLSWRYFERPIIEMGRKAHYGDRRLEGREG